MSSLLRVHLFAEKNPRKRAHEPNQRKNQANHQRDRPKLVGQKFQRKKDEFAWPFGIRLCRPHLRPPVLMDATGPEIINAQTSVNAGFLPITALTPGKKPCRFIAYLVTLSPTPTPLSALLLQTKGKVQFDSTVDRAVEAFFGSFRLRIWALVFAPSQSLNLLFG
jgi:hypothetical protein